MKQELLDWSNKVHLGYQLTKENPHIQNFSFPKPIEHILFIGMGGSGIAGTILKSLLAKTNPHLRVTVSNTPRMPAYIPPQTLAIVMSYSGNTWETLDGFAQLFAAQTPICIITHGGKLATHAEAHNIPCIIMPECSAPRASLGSTLGILFALLEQVQLIAGATLAKITVSAADRGIAAFAEPTFFKSFLELCKNDPQLHIWGVTDDSDSAAYRAQTQFNENSKIPAITTYFPELCHNLIVGIADCKKPQLVLSFATSFLLAHEQAGLSAAHEVLAEHGVPVYQVPVMGTTWEEQLIRLILWADFASYHLGVQRGVEITPVVAIDKLKKNYMSRITF